MTKPFRSACDNGFVIHPPRHSPPSSFTPLFVILSEAKNPRSHPLPLFSPHPLPLSHRERGETLPLRFAQGDEEKTLRFAHGQGGNAESSF